MTGYRSFILRTLLVLLSASLASAQQAQQAAPTPRITPNFKDADITQIAEAVSAATGKTFSEVARQRVRAQTKGARHV